MEFLCVHPDDIGKESSSSSTHTVNKHWYIYIDSTILGPEMAV